MGFSISFFYKSLKTVLKVWLKVCNKGPFHYFFWHLEKLRAIKDLQKKLLWLQTLM